MLGRCIVVIALVKCMGLILVSSLLAQEMPPGDYQITMPAEWRIKKTDSAGDLSTCFFKKDLDDSTWTTTSIKEEGHPPYPDKFIFYRRWVDVPAGWKDKKVELSLAEVGDECLVYVNEQKVGECKGRARVCVDVTDKLQCGGRNLIAVMCQTRAKQGGMVGPIALYLPEEAARAKAARDARLRAEMRLSQIPYKIVYETYRDGNWELCMVNADGTNQMLLTNTPNLDELYPHVSPDGTKICFVVDEPGEGKKSRNLYYMNIDGTGRVKIADNAREGCWSPDGKKIAYLKGEFEKYTLTDYANKGVFIYDLETKTHLPHVNKGLHHLYNLCWSPDGNWFVATVHGGMGFRHAIIAFEADGTRVFDLGKWKVGGCRPDLSPDGKKIGWGANDETMCVADIDFSGDEPKVSNIRPIARCQKGFENYHIDWSPDGQHVAFSHGPAAGEMVGQRAEGWNICVGDLTGRWVPITTDGKDNKEPDWVPIPAGVKK